MGLDISVYGKAERLAPQPEADAKGHYSDEIYESENLVHAFAYSSMEQSLRGLEPWQEKAWEGGERYFDAGWWKVTPTRDDFDFRAGSYSGYNSFREQLAQAALDVTPRAVWDRLDFYRERPFFELINFADNEGTIGPLAAADLAQDFRDQRSIVLAAWHDVEEESWFTAKYDEWQRAFDVASGHGIVAFH